MATILQRVGEDSSIKKPNFFINTLITEKILKANNKKLFWKTEEVEENTITTPELIATEEGYIKNEDTERLISFRNNPSDESWIK